MNSVVQEASSISKAVEQAWIKAGKPQEFSIRIFQDAQRNFLGITSQPAKIALLFEPKNIKEKSQTKEIKRQSPKQKKQPNLAPLGKKEVAEKKQTTKKPTFTKPTANSSFPNNTEIKTDQKQETQKSNAPWSDEMVATARNWMKDMLTKMECGDITFTTDVKRYHLRFTFSKPVASTPEKQKAIFRNFAHLIMQSIRNQLRKQFRYHKVVISSDL